MPSTSTDLNSPRSNPQRTRELLEGALRGDERSWRLIFAAHQEFLLYVLRTLSVNSSQVDPEDVLQVAFLQAWKRIDRFEYRGVGSLRRWLRRIAENALIDALRRSNRVPTPGPEVDLARDTGAAGPDEAAADKELSARLLRCLARLPEDERDIVIMRKLEGLTWEEICALDGRPRTSVRRSYERSLDRLQAWMA